MEDKKNERAHTHTYTDTCTNTHAHLNSGAIHSAEKECAQWQNSVSHEVKITVHRFIKIYH